MLLLSASEWFCHLTSATALLPENSLLPSTFELAEHSWLCDEKNEMQAMLDDPFH